MSKNKSIRDVLNQHSDNICTLLQTEEILQTLRSRDILNNTERANIASYAKQPLKQSQELINLLIEKKTEEQLVTFCEVLRDDFNGRNNPILYKGLLAEYCSKRREDDLTDGSRSKKLKRTIVGYPYDVMDVAISPRTSKKYWKFKLLADGRYYNVVVIDILQDVQTRIKDIQPEGGKCYRKCLEITGYDFKGEDTIFLNDNTLVNTIDAAALDGMQFKRKIFQLEKVRHMHIGSVVDIKVNVVKIAVDNKNDDGLPINGIESEPLSTNRSSGDSNTAVEDDPLVSHDVIVADANQHMWVWLTEKQRQSVHQMLTEGMSYIIRKCKVGKLYDLKFIKMEEESIIEETDHVEPQEFTKVREAIESYRITEEIGMIKMSKPDRINIFRRCPECSSTTERDVADPNDYRCTNCNSEGCITMTELTVIASPSLTICGTKEHKEITLYSSDYYGQDCFTHVIEANDVRKEYNPDDFDNRKVAKLLRSSTNKWKVKLTPARNVIRISLAD